MEKKDNKLGYKKTLVIIDGKSVFYRGYYAMGNLSKSDGTPTSGVYGFATIAMEVVKRLKPDKVVVAWDKAKTSTTKRKAIFQDYKAGRVKPPEDFYAQIPLLKELIDALGWGFLECDDYEADDIIGTLALQADNDLQENGLSKWLTYIVSSDLDMLQIVDENTRMYRLLKGFSELEELDVPAVEAKYSIKKDQFLDLKSIKGDNSDNIPGVPGIGEKGAAKLLNDYGSLDGVYQHIDEIKGSLHDKLVAGKESAYMSYQLAKIMTDAPVTLEDVPELVVKKERIIDALKNLEFNSLVRKYNEELSKLDNAKSEILDDTNRDEDSVDKDDNVDSSEIDASSIEVPKDVLIENSVKAKMHADEGFAKKVLNGAKYWDIEQADFLINPLARTEENTLLKELDEEKRKKYQIENAAFSKLDKVKKIYTDFDLPLIPVLYKMEKAGIKIDRKYFNELKTEYQQHIAEIEQKIYSVAGEEFNINSPLQMSQILFEKLLLPTKGIKKTTRGYSTGVKELEKLQSIGDELKNELAESSESQDNYEAKKNYAAKFDILPLLMEYREASKLLSTYITPLPEMADENDRVHTTFTQNVTATGRLSSLNPNLQNIPVRTEEGKRIRGGFIADSGKVLVSADYAQFELRLAAVLSGDQKLIEIFNSGLDVHTKTASEVFNVPMDKVTKKQRRAAKVINFGVMYGMSPKGLADAAGMSFGEAKAFIDDYFKVRSPIKEYLDKILEQAKTVGYVETYYGRRRPTPDVKSSNFIIRQAAERAAQNMPIQGTEADLMKKAMIEVDKKLSEIDGADLILQIHDSLIIECDKNLTDKVTTILEETMENVAPELKINLKVEVTTGVRWNEL